jgi:hypothetical protein
MQTISFKIEEEVAQALEYRAAQQKGSSRHTIARQIVVDALTNAGHERVVEEIAQVRGQIERLGDEFREDVATVCVALLVQAGKVQQAEAEGWVRKAILDRHHQMTDADLSEEG